jgi:SAM-dependent methyltransferase
MIFNKAFYTLLRSIKPMIDSFCVPLYQLRKIPFSLGYNSAKWRFIKKSLNNPDLISSFENGKIPFAFGLGFDERVVEYPWIFSKLPLEAVYVLDAGSTFNFRPIVEHAYFRDKHLSIFTFYPESVNFPGNSVSYQYGDLREMPYSDNHFEVVVSHSTIEHIDMDNSIYGYEISHIAEQKKSLEYLKAVHEFYRVLKPNGTLLITFPYGKFRNYGFFQQFDAEMVGHIKESLSPLGKLEFSFIKYNAAGWQFDGQVNCDDSTSHNPHTGEDKGSDGAAHCRCVCCVKFTKN